MASRIKTLGGNEDWGDLDRVKSRESVKLN